MSPTMRVTKTLILVLITNIGIMIPQNVCESPEEKIEDLNSITTKCTIEKKETLNSSGEKIRKLSVKVSTSTRFLKKVIKKEEANNLGALTTSGIQQTNANSEISNSLAVKKNNFQKINKFTEKLSKEELKKALEFSNVDQIPLFKSCENKGVKQNLSCFNQKMIAHIQKHFEYPKEALLNKIQGNVWIRFIIDEEGIVTNIKSLGPKKGAVLQHEAERVVSMLSSFKPALKNGKKVFTKYGFPINFSLEN